MRTGHLASSDDMNDVGCFQIPYKGTNTSFIVIATHGVPPIPGYEPWEHVSVRAFDDSKSAHAKERMPTWEEMCFIKDLFWLPEECVVQFHPPKSEYVNRHPNVLHLWRKVGYDMPTPPKIYIG